jgi:L-asparaginase/Glu-tRNA(Gln) amidotransferase subunit D
MIPILASALVLAASGAGAPKPSTVSGLVSTGQMIVRVVVADRCTVTSTGATCEGAAPIRPLAVSRIGPESRVDIVF